MAGRLHPLFVNRGGRWADGHVLLDHAEVRACLRCAAAHIRLAAVAMSDGALGRHAQAMLKAAAASAGSHCKRPTPACARAWFANATICSEAAGMLPEPPLGAGRRGLPCPATISGQASVSDKMRSVLHKLHDRLDPGEACASLQFFGCRGDFPPPKYWLGAPTGFDSLWPYQGFDAKTRSFGGFFAFAVKNCKRPGGKNHEVCCT